MVGDTGGPGSIDAQASDVSSGTGNCTGKLWGACGAGDSCDPGLVCAIDGTGNPTCFATCGTCPNGQECLAFTSESFCYPTDDMLPPCS